MGSGPHRRAAVQNVSCFQRAVGAPTALKGTVLTQYWIDVAGCQRVISELRAIVDESNEFQWVWSDARMVDRHTYAAQESSNTKGDAEKVDRQYTAFYDEKLEPTYDSMLLELNNCINAMEEAVDYYASGDAAMAYDSANMGNADFPEYRSGDGSSTSDIPAPSGNGEPTRMYVPPRMPDPDNPLTNEHYTDHPYEYASNVQDQLG